MQAYICSMYTSKWTEAICAMPRRRSLHKSCLYCSGWVRNNRGDNVLRLLKSSVATGTMHAGRKQKSRVSGYAMRRWPGRNNVKSGMGKIEPSKVPHPLLRTAFPLYGAAHIKGKSLYMIAAPRWRQASAHERCYPLRPQGPKSGVSWQTTTLNSSVKPTKPSHFVIPTHTFASFTKSHRMTRSSICSFHSFSWNPNMGTSTTAPSRFAVMPPHSSATALPRHDRSSLSAITTTSCPSPAFACALLASLVPAARYIISASLYFAFSSSFLRACQALHEMKATETSSWCVSCPI